MSWIKTLSVLSAICSAAGTILLFRGSFAYESMSYMDDADFSITKGIAKRNRDRQAVQRWGLSLLLAGVALQVASVCLGP